MRKTALNVTGADLGGAVRALEGLGLRLLRDLVDGGGVRPREWLTRAEIRQLDRMPAHRIGWRRALARAHPALERSLTPPSWLRATDVDIRRHGVAGWKIPDRLLPLLGDRAW